MAGSWDPTIVMGIDFGMTCTGVAYASKGQWDKVVVIQRWPDSNGGVLNKNHSQVAYNSAGDAVDWGRCTLSDQISKKEREFKLHLDPAYADEGDDGLSHGKAITYYIDYMAFLKKHLDAMMETRVPRWQQQQVEYRFSIPTTWTNVRLTNDLKSWLAAAGFVNTAYRRVIFSRTEAEAAAVYAAAERTQRNDVLMVVDAGGATTDINILKISNKTAEITQMLALEKDVGLNIGAVQIDVEARKVIVQKLKAAHIHGGPSNNDLRWLADGMMERHGYEYFKRGFGTEEASTDLIMAIPDRPRDPHIVLKSSELKSIFDPLVDKLIQNISDRISSLARTAPQENLKYIVLSGGLGSSAYVKQQLKARFCQYDTQPENARNVQILDVAEPQLAVAKGLVMDRSQTLGYNVKTWIGRCCRVSYGVLYRVPHDPKIHAGEPTVKDPISGEIWVEDQIDWLIRQGQVVPEEGIKKKFSLRVTKNMRHDLFRAHIVMSELPARDLPTSKHRGPLTRLCVVEGRFDPEDFTSGEFKTARKLFAKKVEHDKAEFYLKVDVGSADISFEFQSLDGRTYTQDTQKVKVIWHDAEPPAPHVNHHGRIFPSTVR